MGARAANVKRTGKRPQFEFRCRQVFGRFGFGARASIRLAIHSMSCAVADSPASCASVTRNDDSRNSVELLTLEAAYHIDSA